MNINYAEVILWGNRIGIVSYDDNDKYAKFEYDKEFLKSGIELSPIMMPLNDSVYYFPTLNKDSFNGLPGLLSDSLPDSYGNKIIESWLLKNGRSLDSFSPVEALCYIGERGMGALEYKPSTGPDISKEKTIEIDKLAKLASDVLDKKKSLRLDENNINHANLLKFSTSAGGARAKAIVAYNRKTKRFFSGQIANKKNTDYFIIKFDNVQNNGDHDEKDNKGYTRIEYAYYLMAKEAHINMNECFLYEDGNARHFMTLRFDREKNTGRKIHMLSLGAMAHLDYNKPKTCSYELAANICSKLNIGDDEIQELFRRMVFNVLAINNDDHVKNISFLMDKQGRWKLAPAYDLTFAYKSTSPWVGEHQMLINGKSKDISYEDLLESANTMNIKKTKAKTIIKEVIVSLKKWDEYATQAEVFTSDKDLIKEMINKSISLIQKSITFNE